LVLAYIPVGYLKMRRCRLLRILRSAGCGITTLMLLTRAINFLASQLGMRKREKSLRSFGSLCRGIKVICQGSASYKGCMKAPMSNMKERQIFTIYQLT